MSAALTGPTVSGLEVGRRNPTYLNLLKLVKALGVSLVALRDFAPPRR